MKTYRFTNKGFNDERSELQKGKLYHGEPSPGGYLDIYEIETGERIREYYPARFE